MYCNRYCNTPLGCAGAGAHGASVAGGWHGRAGAKRARARGEGGRWAVGRGRRAAGREARGRRGAGTGRAQPGRWARRLARATHSVHSAWFSTRFFDSVFFLSH